MVKASVKVEDQAAQTSLRFLQAALGEYHPRNFAVELWDGTRWEPEAGQPARCILRIKRPGALRRMFLPATELALAEAYLYDDFDIEGEIYPIFDLADWFLERKISRSQQLRYARELLKLPADGRPQDGRQAAQLSGSAHSQERDRQAVTYHYDVSNDFYRLYLDERMVYSCAYFAAPDEDLDTAQARKLDYICRKLRLRPGERLLDIGCGWGGLVIHAAQRYGVEALGITLSRPQAELANERIAAAGLVGRARVEVRDYRDVDEPAGYDKLVSVGMFEHVGEKLLPEYFARAYGLLKAGGVFLNHGIACNANAPAAKGPTFSDRYVFPDGELVPISTTLRVAEKSNFEVRDVESLREHYALTLRHWVRRLEAQHAQAVQYTDEVTYRVWRLFMSGSAHGFEAGRLNVYQTLLAKPERGRSGLPLTRADWYA